MADELGAKQWALLAAIVGLARDGSQPPDRLRLHGILPDWNPTDLDALLRESLIAVSDQDSDGDFFWRVTNKGFAEFERRLGEAWAAAVEPAPSRIASPASEVLRLESFPPSVGVSQWFDRVPLGEPPTDILDPSRRAEVIEKLREAIRELNGESASGREWSMFESALFANLAVPGIQLAVAAIEIGEALRTRWQQARGMLIAAVERLEATKAAIVAATDKRLTSPTSQLVAGVVLTTAIDLIRGLLS